MEMEIDFSKVKGQETAKKILENAVLFERYPPLYLFVGPRGVGKATMAVEFAKAANCVSNDVRPCGQCSQCHKIERFVHPDVHFLLPDKPEGLRQKLGQGGGVRPPDFDPSREISIRQVREIQYELSRPPVEARHRFVIILNGENLTIESQNALLKTLEEPPSNTTFVIVSDNPDLILPTIRSRARTVKFHYLGFNDFVDFFKSSTVSPAVLYRLSNGSVGEAKELINWGIISLRNQVLEILIKKDLDLLTTFIGELYVEKPLVSKFIAFYGVLFRDILLAKLGMSNLITNVDMKDRITEAASALHWKVIEDVFEAVKRAERALKRNVNIQFILYSVFKPIFRYEEIVVV